jgi:hypothetical protein
MTGCANMNQTVLQATRQPFRLDIGFWHTTQIPHCVGPEGTRLRPFRGLAELSYLLSQTPKRLPGVTWPESRGDPLGSVKPITGA